MFSKPDFAEIIYNLHDLVGLKEIMSFILLFCQQGLSHFKILLLTLETKSGERLCLRWTAITSI